MKKIISTVMLILLCVIVSMGQDIHKIFSEVNIPISEEENASTLLKNFLKVPEEYVFVQIFNEEDTLGFSHIRFFQKYEGLSLIGTDIWVHIKNKTIVTINGSFYKGEIPMVVFSLDKMVAQKYAISYLEEKYAKIDITSASTVSIEKVLIPKNGKIRSAYMVHVKANNLYVNEKVFIDAENGDVLGFKTLVFDVSATASTRYSGTRSIETTQIGSVYYLQDLSRGNGIYTYNMQHSETSGTLFVDSDNIWTEYHNAQKDDAALDAHWGVEKTYDYFYNTFNRNGFDDNGQFIQVFVHYGNNYENAFSSENQLVFGDGATNFDALTSLDVVAHEYAHSICLNTADLEYKGESGAINESLSDIWASCVEYAVAPNKQTWLVGDEIDLRPTHIALRSMSNPNAEGQPDTYGGTYWVNVSGCIPTDYNDNCGVHTNNGIMNFWFYLLCNGGSGTNDLNENYDVQSIGMHDAAKIVYRAESLYLTTTSSFVDARRATLRAAEDLFSSNIQYNAVAEAWHAVGVDCEPFLLTNENITTNRSIQECSVEIENVSVLNNAQLEIETVEGTLIKKNFSMNLGSTLLIE